MLLILINHNIFDISKIGIWYDKITLKFSGEQNEILDIIECMYDIMPYCVHDVQNYISDNSVILDIFYVNGKNNFEYLTNLIDVVVNDYQDIVFDISYSICCYDKIANFAACIFGISVFILLKFYHLFFTKLINKSTHYICNVFGIVVSIILSVITMIYFEKVTQVISLAIYNDEQKVKLMHNIIVNVIIICLFHCCDLFLQLFRFLFFCYTDKNNNFNVDNYDKK